MHVRNNKIAHAERRDIKNELRGKFIKYRRNCKINTVRSSKVVHVRVHFCAAHKVQ